MSETNSPEHDHPEKAEGRTPRADLPRPLVAQEDIRIPHKGMHQDLSGAAAAEGMARSTQSEADLASKARASRAMHQPPTLLSAARLQDKSDKWLFVGFLIVGGAGTFILKRMGIDPLLAAGLAVVMMLAYALTAAMLPKVRLRPDRLGDNCYYMGFIITLASMSAALIDLQGGAEVSTLIGSFGIALFSTIAGIALRVFCQQMRTEIEDVEERVRRDLLDAAQKLRGQLTSAISDIESFRLGSQQAVEARLRESLEWHERLSSERLAMMEGVISSMIQRLEGAFVAQEEVLVHLRDSGGETVAALRGVSKRLSAIKAPEDLIERKLEQTMIKIGNVIQTFEASATSELERQQNVAGASRAMRDIVAQLGQELFRVREQIEAFGQISRPSETLAGTLERMAESVEKIGASITRQQVAVEDAALTAQRMLAQSLEASQGALRGLEGHIAEANNNIAGGAAQLGQNLRETAHAIASQRDTIREAASEAALAKAHIANDLIASRAAMAELQQLLTDAARSVASVMTKPLVVSSHG